MLVLGRTKDRGKNTIIIDLGDNKVIRIVVLRGDNVKLGFDAPPNIRIWREEIK